MRLSTVLSLVLLSFVGGCATQGADQAVPGQGKEATPPPNQPPSEEDEANAPPHALGSIRLGESRASATGDSNPLVSITFVPDAKLAKSCTRKVAGCEIAETAQCVTGTAAGCKTGEVCAFNNACEPVCIGGCATACESGEECAINPSGSGMACRKKDRFDAGAIAFDGTTMAITAFPPYALSPEGSGAPFMPRAQIKIMATGGIKAGFEKFEDTFTTTTYLEADPPLADITRTQAFGTGDLKVGWRPGEDTVYVSVTGPAGTAKCKADDATGTYELSRDVIDEVTKTAGSAAGGGGFAIAISRERREVKKDKKTFGTLSGGRTIQPNGWLELITTSGESHSFVGCSSGQQLCGDTCTSLMSDSLNCGTCGNKCPTGMYCSSGTCF